MRKGLRRGTTAGRWGPPPPIHCPRHLPGTAPVVAWAGDGSRSGKQLRRKGPRVGGGVDQVIKKNQSTGGQRRHRSEQGIPGRRRRRHRRKTNSNAGPIQPSGRGLPLPRIPIWARWVLGSIVCLALPFYKRILKIQDGVEKAAETVLETIEKVAEITEEIASDVADALPGDGSLKEAALKIEAIADQIDKDAEKAEAFLHKVDQIEEEVDSLVEPIIEKGEVIEKEIQAEKEAKEGEMPADKEANPSTSQSKDTGETK